MSLGTCFSTRSFIFLLTCLLGIPQALASPQGDPNAGSDLPVARQRETTPSPSARRALDDALASATRQSLHETSRWRRLLFITPGWFSDTKSLVDSDTFFFSSQGRTQPAAELAASLEAMFHGADDYAGPDVHPQCRFPARLAFFKETLGIPEDALPKPRCAKFEDWFGNTRGDGVSLVFTNYFLNNPSSMFGHTFLRVHKPGISGTSPSETATNTKSAESAEPAEPAETEVRLRRRSPLLDWSVSFAAFPTTSNPLLYAVMGLAGGFPGRFSMMPHYVKAQEYNNHESRDLWEYDLAVKEEGVTRMLLSLWEIGNEHIDYYYFDDNCAYILLALIELARDDVELTRNFYFWVTPSDTVRVVARVPGLVRDVSYRPSNLSRFLERWDALDAHERRETSRFTDTPESFAFDAAWESRPPDSRARILDVMLEYIDYEEKLALGKDAGSRWLPVRERILRERARTRVVSAPLVRRPDHERPDLGHSTNRVGLTGGVLVSPRREVVRGDTQEGSPSAAFGQLEWRPSLHDMMAPGVGYPPGMELDFWDMAVRWREDSRRVTLHRLNLLDIVSPQPLSGLLRPVSWRFRLGTEQRERCHGRSGSCFLTGLSGGAGLALADHGRRALAFLLPGADVGSSQEKGASLFGGPSVTAGLVLRPSDPVRLGLRGRWVRRFGLGGAALFDWETRVDAAFAPSTNWEARVSAAYGSRALEREALEASLSVYRYYE